MATMQPVTTGVTGLGGWADVIVKLLEQCEGDQECAVKLTCVCSSNPARHADRVAELEAKGVKVLDSYEALLAEPIEAAWLPVPIDLHRPFVEQALAAGKAVMCEKPAAGTIQDIDAMIAARDRSRRPAVIGFQDIYDPTTLAAKRRLLEGAIGKVHYASVHACWPRHDSYYNRVSWAGTLKRNGAWVLDSPPNNALAHYLNMPLFLLGAALQQSATPVAIESELYRVNPIDSYDTACYRLQLAEGPTLLMLFTHACEDLIQPRIVLHGDKGKLIWERQEMQIQTPEGTQTLKRLENASPTMVRRFSQLVRGVEDDDIAVATMETARSHTLAINAAAEASPIRDVPRTAYRTLQTEFGSLLAIAGIESAFEKCIQEQCMLHEAGVFDWTRPGGKLDLADYDYFGGPASANA